MARSKTLPEEAILSKIHLFRGQKVMIDRDLAELYGAGSAFEVWTKQIELAGHEASHDSAGLFYFIKGCGYLL